MKGPDFTVLGGIERVDICWEFVGGGTDYWVGQLREFLAGGEGRGGEGRRGEEGQAGSVGVC